MQRRGSPHLRRGHRMAKRAHGLLQRGTASGNMKQTRRAHRLFKRSGAHLRRSVGLPKASRGRTVRTNKRVS